MSINIAYLYDIHFDPSQEDQGKVDKHIVEKIIDAVTSFIHTQGVPEFYDDEAIDLLDTLTTTDMMHFGVS